MRHFQIRENDKTVEHRVYPTLETACRALVQQNRRSSRVVELDAPSGTVVREFTFAECQEILRSSSHQD